MCGITGVLDRGGARASEADIAAMTDALAHRGPDGRGVLVEGPLALGHRRLAVVDLTDAAAQPMTSADGRFVIVYNGEVYNFRELRAQLERDHGHNFRSTGDTEVVLEYFARWGVDCLQHFNGMFAFAVWDRRERQLTLVRDRYGIKPLYVTWLGRRLLFASEIKGFLAASGFSVDVDREALLEYFTFQNFLGDRTLFDGVRLLEPATWMRVSADEVISHRWWDWRFDEPEYEPDHGEVLEELDERFGVAVRRQLVSDVPVSAYLSGGMDSGSISAIAAQEIPNLRSFTVGFDLHSASGLELGFDERRRAEHMSYLFGTEHYEMVLKAGDLERCMSRLVWHLEEPRVGQSYPNFFAAQLAAKFGKVVLSGAGGDEVFAGYPWRYYRAVVNDDFEHYIDQYYDFWQRLVPSEQVKDVFAPIWKDVSHVDTRDLVREVFVHHADELDRPEDYINHSLYFEARTFLHGLLVVEDKLSMAHGLETRVPFLDNDLVDSAMRIPVDLKLGNLGEVVRLNENDLQAKARQYFERTTDGKLILREMMERYVPSEVTDGVKQGFSAPDASWFRGESVGYLRRRLIEESPLLYEYLDRDAVVGLVEEHVSGRSNRRLLMWSLLYVEEWMRQFLAGERPAEVAG